MEDKIMMAGISLINDSKKSDINEVIDYLQNKSLILYSQNAIWMEDNKVNRYYGIWKRLTKLIGSDFIAKSEDFNMIIDGNQIKFAGVALIEPSLQRILLETLIGTPDSIFIVTNESFDLIVARLKNAFKETLFSVDFFNHVLKTEVIFKYLVKGESLIVPDFSRKEGAVNIQLKK